MAPTTNNELPHLKHFNISYYSTQDALFKKNGMRLLSDNSLGPVLYIRFGPIQKGHRFPVCWVGATMPDPMQL
jgi:hypothetical protein